MCIECLVQEAIKRAEVQRIKDFTVGILMQRMGLTKVTVTSEEIEQMTNNKLTVAVVAVNGQFDLSLLSATEAEAFDRVMRAQGHRGDTAQA